MKMRLSKTILLLGLLSFSLAKASETTNNPTILYVGDSHSYGKLGSVIEKNLSTISNNIIMESSCGSTASTWLGKSVFYKTICGFWKKDNTEEIRTKNHRIPKFAEEIEKYQPQVIIVQLGTNMAASERPTLSSASIEEMMKKIKEANALCIWIGPPDANSKIVTKEKLAIVNTLINDLATKNGCHYIDSLKLTKFPKNNPEGIHYPPTLASKWGEKASSIILEIIHSN